VQVTSAEVFRRLVRAAPADGLAGAARAAGRITGIRDLLADEELAVAAST
jgi:hypothetical protein